MSLYGAGGINYHMPSSQHMNIEVYESDGHDYYTTFVVLVILAPIGAISLVLERS
jgi:hypothetical protein